jgi:hypothetical protein
MASFDFRAANSRHGLFWDCGQVGEHGVIVKDNPCSSARRCLRTANALRAIIRGKK